MSCPTTLTVAREKLQAMDTPLLLRVSYYLRVSCLALDSNHLRYSSLMKSLYQQNSAWLETCLVTPQGYLQSSDRAINQLLWPITALHQADQTVEQPLPVSA